MTQKLLNLLFGRAFAVHAQNAATITPVCPRSLLGGNWPLPESCDPEATAGLSKDAFRRQASSRRKPVALVLNWLLYA